MEDKGTCIQCKWYMPNPDQDYGECRAESPGIDDDNTALWPLVAEGDWCGDFEEGL